MKGLNPREQQNLEQDLRQILGFTILGGVRWQNVVVAQIRAKEWSSVTMPPSGEERGGSSSPVEIAERVEDRKVAQMASRDAQVLPVLVEALDQELVIAGVNLTPSRELATVAENLARIVARYVRPVDHSLLPTGSPGCRSCARKDPKKGITGHHSEVSQRYLSKGLCDQCGRYAGANKGKWPPLQFVDVLARQGKHAAGRWLARNTKGQAA